MKKRYWFVLATWFTCEAKAQQHDTASVTKNNSLCSRFTVMKAKQLLHKKKPSLVLQGGIISAIQKPEKVFAKRYGISFIDTGCVVDDTTCIKQFNEVAIQYLDKNFGKKWRKKIPQPIIGL